jgi:2-polyprenyl-6-methoxyphenol hydroxylase-like FAD-dependent oxidoreductase
MSTPLIAGAGPVGLTAALLLARQGIETRIIDKAPSPAATSRALAVNPRTLELLEESGITAEMLARGLKIQTVQMRQNGKTAALLSLTRLKHRYPFMLALSQAATESLLAEALRKMGREVERGVTLTACRQNGQGIEAMLQTARGTETVQPAWIFDAEGSHSAVREQLKLGFDGSTLPEPWYLADVPLRTDLRQDAAHVEFFDDGGFMFLIRVVNDIRQPEAGDPLWRVITNFPNPLGRLPQAAPSGAIVWEGSFHIAHRVASTLNQGNVYLAGDAAHIHSPMGARGMNLGIEDAWTFAQLMKAGRLGDYDALRRPIDRRVVRRVEFFTNIVRGQSALTRFLRGTMPGLASHIPFVYDQIVATATGLDHPV